MGITGKAKNGVWSSVETVEKVSFSNWAPGQPKKKGKKDCVCMIKKKNFKWKNVPCKKKGPFICEKGMFLVLLQFCIVPVY